MTDNEIKKGLECHKERELATCQNCPLLNIDGCAYELSEYALSLINRQKAEIERLQAEVDKVNHDYILLCSDVAENRAEAIKEFAERFWLRIYADMQIDTGTYDRLDNHINYLVKEMVGDNNE